jgi:hypothetical protein
LPQVAAQVANESGKARRSAVSWSLPHVQNDGESAIPLANPSILQNLFLR